MPVVGYFTDFIPGVTESEPAILANGFTPVQILDIDTFDFTTVDILMINEPNNGPPSAALIARMPDVEAYVRGGGVVVVHDRFVSNGGPETNPFLVGHPALLADREPDGDGAFIDVTPPGGTLVTNGPHGVIDDTSLDGGTLSAHGFVDRNAILAIGGTPILHRDISVDQTVAFSYFLDSGAVYYSTIPLDFYLAGFGPNPPRDAFTDIYAPNMLAYANSLRQTPEPGSILIVVLVVGAIAWSRRRRVAAAA